MTWGAIAVAVMHATAVAHQRQPADAYQSPLMERPIPSGRGCNGCGAHSFVRRDDRLVCTYCGGDR